MGGPEWMGADRFDITATASAEGWSRDRAAEMVRALVVAKPGTLGANLAGDSDIPPLPTALPTQLGLKLEAQRGPVDVLVIDRVEKPAAD